MLAAIGAVAQPVCIQLHVEYMQAAVYLAAPQQLATVPQMALASMYHLMQSLQHVDGMPSMKPTWYIAKVLCKCKQAVCAMQNDSASHVDDVAEDKCLLLRQVGRQVLAP